jgi:hypothetical protein
VASVRYRVRTAKRWSAEAISKDCNKYEVLFISILTDFASPEAVAVVATLSGLPVYQFHGVTRYTMVRRLDRLRLMVT